MAVTECVDGAVGTTVMKCVAGLWTAFKKGMVRMSLTGIQAGPLVRGSGTMVGRHGVRLITSRGTEQHVLCLVFDAVLIIIMFVWLDVHSVQNVEMGRLGLAH